MQNQQATCQALLNARFASEVDIIGFPHKLPALQLAGPMPLPVDLQGSRDVHNARLQQQQRPNDWHALLTSAAEYKKMPPSLDVHTVDFATVCALREHGHKPPIVSACAVLICADKREIIVHRRSSHSATAPNALHTIGGAYLPQSASQPADADLLATMLREIKEETGLVLQVPTLPPMMCSQELATGFIQFVFLGLVVPTAALEQLSNSWEGSAVCIGYDELGEALSQPDWVTSGKVHVLAWLALGAPGINTGQRFDGLTATQLFETFFNR
ncbi:NUDIX domain-containing protein [Undibacterium sp.]|uniref:NUDIX domain-containing protein n=1 Tax=Undibacterium sp. TaxID=1914977 RepID=UPI00374CDBC2